MNFVERLHTAARLYCKSPPDGEEVERGCRWDVRDAILIEVERFVPAEFGSVAEAKEQLSLAGQTTPLLTNAVRWGRKEPWAAAAIADERERFCAFVSQFDPATAAVEPLPYRRVLSQAEASRLQAALKQTWGTEPYSWYPLPDDPREYVGEFDADGFHQAVEDKAVRAILRRHGVKRVYEFPEYGPICEIDLDSLEPRYDPERFWFDESLSWVLFASHEHSIAVGGQWLLDGLRQLWPEWQLPEWRRKKME